MRSRIQKWGDGLALRIPSAFAKHAVVAQGDEVDLSLEDGRIVIRPVPREQLSLAALLEGITPDNQHDEVDSGPPRWEGNAVSTPGRGDIVWLDFTPQSGHEQAGRRPALILSPSSYNGKTGLALVCLITSRRKGYPFEVALPDGLPVTGTVLADQIESLDWRARAAEVACAAPADIVDRVRTRITVLLEQG